MDQYIINTPELQMTQLDLFVRLLVACGIGLLLGLEREHSALIKKEHVFAGIRTFVLLTLTGFAGAALNFLLSSWAFAVIIFGVIVLTAISYWITSMKGDIGGTSELAGLLAVSLGALVFLGYIELSLMMTVIILVMLSSKVRLMNVIGQITREEIYALVRFVVIALLLFPFLPDEDYGPYGMLNPREVGWVIIITSGIGFLGYVLMRVFGANKGILMTGVLGGLVSSTMVTWVFAKKSKELPAYNNIYTSAILAACTIMMVRIFLWVFLFNKQLLPSILVPVLLLFLTGVGVTVFFYLKDKKEEAERVGLPLGKPLDLSTAFLFGVMFVVIVFVINYANEFFGQEGIYVTSAIAGISDVDAITISITKMSAINIPPLTAQNAILIAAFANTVSKFVLALWFSGNEMKRNIFIGYGAFFAAFVVAFVVLNV